MKQVCLLFLFCLLALAGPAQGKGHHHGGGNSGNGVGNGGNDEDLPDDPDTQVPFDSAVPYLVAGAIVYGAWTYRKKENYDAN